MAGSGSALDDRSEEGVIRDFLSIAATSEPLEQRVEEVGGRACELRHAEKADADTRALFVSVHSHHLAGRRVFPVRASLALATTLSFTFPAI